MSKLKNVRQAKGMTQKALAEKTGISLRTIQHYEQGSKDLNMAAAATLLRISQALGCTMEDLIQKEREDK